MEQSWAVSDVSCFLPPSLSFPLPPWPPIPPSLAIPPPPPPLRPRPRACLSLSLACGILAARCGCCAVQTGNDAHPTPSRDRDRDRDLTETEREGGREGWSRTEGDLQVLSPSLPLYRIAIDAEIAYPIWTCILHSTSPPTRYQHKYLHTTGVGSA